MITTERVRVISSVNMCVCRKTNWSIRNVDLVRFLSDCTEAVFVTLAIYMKEREQKIRLYLESDSI